MSFHHLHLEAPVAVKIQDQCPWCGEMSEEEEIGKVRKCLDCGRNKAVIVTHNNCPDCSGGTLEIDGGYCASCNNTGREHAPYGEFAWRG